MKGLPGAPNTNCNKAGAPPPPDNTNPLYICEEVRESGAAEDYIAGTRLWERPGQAAAAANKDDIQFPRPAVEIKADWIQVSSIGDHTVDCNELAQAVHVEIVDGSCFALAGMHLISKLIDKWIWATFEPQNPITNPYRCKVLGRYDPFGSQPARSNGATTQLTRKLEALMGLGEPCAGVAELSARRGADRPQPSEAARQLDHRRENVGMQLTQASCISCHAVSSVKSDGTDGINLLAAMTNPPVGFPQPLPSKDWICRDFVWSLGLACPNGPGNMGSLQNCGH